ncbi:peptidase S8 and S53 [Candidatus Rhodobacter oscarellae]|uniref:Peptidase S8 and S53 n=1 Tax=Candidatus Rhodobacter oscarellae TaxID=1675527 RepID=A0A0J9E0L9_9RHOB|nr:S8 family serine peptidase [Candidatus Rhodobacter lobularis]KMW56270.1 peptidase S8 and S53 [Candidatus Rhodobacter lobularis]
MAGLHVLLEMSSKENDAFSRHAAGLESAEEAQKQATEMMGAVGGVGIEIEEDAPPIPMFAATAEDDQALSAFALGLAGSTGRGKKTKSHVVQAEVSRTRMGELLEAPDIQVWPSSPMALLDEGAVAFDLASSRGGVDCRPFRPGVDIATIRELLGVAALWKEGAQGQNIVVGVLDEGIDGSTYPVIGGFARPNSARQPGSAPVTSHGSMCAADILVAAPAARLYDYPFLGVPRSGPALQMMQAALNQFSQDGTPQITNNSYGFTAGPSAITDPRHEVNNFNHPYNRKVREVVAAGIACFFAAGNCGRDCPSGNCHPSGIGPGNSISAANSMEDVVTVAAVNSRHERVGYSAQGPGIFHAQKPDLVSYTHFFGNFGPGRPGGTAQPYDNGTSAATPVAAGVGAALLSAFPGLSPAELKELLMRTATDVGGSVGWDRDHGAGVINAAAAYAQQRNAMIISSYGGGASGAGTA